MTKKLSPLEALERVNKAFHTALIFADVKQKDEETEKALNIIETALKDYEKKTKLAKEYKDVNNVAKRLIALEIIKEKRVNVRCLMSGWKLGNYNSYKAHEKLTQEEYDLLKEVLLCQQ